MTTPAVNEHEKLVQDVKAALISEVNRQLIVAGCGPEGLAPGEEAAAKAVAIFTSLDIEELAEVAVGMVGQSQLARIDKVFAEINGSAAVDQGIAAAVRHKTLQDAEAAYARARNGSECTPAEVDYAAKHLQFTCEVDEKIATFHAELFGPWFGRELRAVREQGVLDTELARLLIPDWKKRMLDEAHRQKHFAFVLNDDGTRTPTTALLIPDVTIMALDGADV